MYMISVWFILGAGKFNAGAGPIQVKGRPRIPTPDVTKEVVDRENRIATNVANMTNQITSGVTLMPHQLSSTYPAYPGEVPFVQVVLSPIQELEGSNSVNNTLHPGQPGTAALAQAVLTPGLGPVSLPMTVSQLTSLGLTKVHSSPLLSRSLQQHNISPVFQHKFSSMPSSPVSETKIKEIVTDEELDNKSNSNSGESISSKDSKESDTNLSNTTASVVSKKDDDLHINGGTELIHLTPKTAPTSITSVNSDDGYRSRKVSATSHQNVPVGPPKRNEVYV